MWTKGPISAADADFINSGLIIVSRGLRITQPFYNDKQFILIGRSKECTVLNNAEQ